MLHLVDAQMNVIVITDQAGEVCVCVCDGVCVKTRVYVCKLPSLCSYFNLCMFLWQEHLGMQCSTWDPTYPQGDQPVRVPSDIQDMSFNSVVLYTHRSDSQLTSRPSHQTSQGIYLVYIDAGACTITVQLCHKGGYIVHKFFQAIDMNVFPAEFCERTLCTA